MAYTRRVMELIERARLRGLRVFERGGMTYILTGKTCRSVGIAIYDDSTAVRSDVRADVAQVIRSVDVMARILGI